jgi:hypothetical protein
MTKIARFWGFYIKLLWINYGLGPKPLAERESGHKVLVFGADLVFGMDLN